MKNLKSKLPVLALALGLGIVFTQSAFTAANTRTDEYGYLNGTWHKFSDPNPGSDDFSRCTDEPLEICTYLFDTPPTSEDTPQNSTPSTRTGVYEIVQ